MGARVLKEEDERIFQRCQPKASSCFMLLFPETSFKHDLMPGFYSKLVSETTKNNQLSKKTNCLHSSI